MMEICAARQTNYPMKNKAFKVAPIAAASFLWSFAEQKDIAESGSGVSAKHNHFASKKMGYAKKAYPILNIV